MSQLKGLGTTVTIGSLTIEDAKEVQYSGRAVNSQAINKLNQQVIQYEPTTTEPGEITVSIWYAAEGTVQATLLDKLNEPVNEECSINYSDGTVVSGQGHVAGLDETGMTDGSYVEASLKIKCSGEWAFEEEGP